MALASLMSPRRGLRALSLLVLLGALLLPFFPSRSATAAGASLTLSPTSGGAGTTINVKGTGFTAPGANSVLTCWQSQPGCGQPGNTGGTVINLNPDGSFISAEFVTISAGCLTTAGATEASCTYPPNCTACVLIATDNGSPTHDQAQATFTYVKTAATAQPPLPPPPAPPAAATATATPTVVTGPPSCTSPSTSGFPAELQVGQSATFQASGFAPGTKVNLTVSGPSLGQTIVLTADSNCMVSQGIEVVASDPPGTYTLMATGPRFGGSGSLSSSLVSYLVPSTQTPTPTPTVTATPIATSTATATATATSTATATATATTTLPSQVQVFGGGTAQPGDAVSIIGLVYYSGWLTNDGLPATVSFTDQHGNSLGPSVATDGNGGFTAPLLVPHELDNTLTITVLATPNDPGYAPSRSTLSYTLSGNTGNGLHMTLQTDKGVYTGGDSITLSGTVTADDGSPVEGASVQLAVLGLAHVAAAGSAVTTDGDGFYSASYGLGPMLNGAGLITAPGVYTVRASATAPSYPDSFSTFAAFTLQLDNAACPARPITVSSVNGNVLYGPPKAANSLILPANLQPGGQIAQGSELTLATGTSVTLSLDLGSGGSSTVTMSGPANLYIGAACTDSTGMTTVQLYTRTANPQGTPGSIQTDLQNVDPSQVNFQVTEYTAPSP